MNTTTLEAALTQRIRNRKTAAAAQILVGLFSTLAIPALLAYLCSRGINPNSPWRDPSSSLTFPTWYLLWFLLLIPAAYFIEYRTQGSFLIRRLREIQNSDGGWYEAITRDRHWRWDARLLAQLLPLSHGIPTDSLRSPNEPTPDFQKSLSFLLFYNLIDISENGQKTWALTTAKSELNTPPPK